MDNTPQMHLLKILKCSDPQRWYANIIGDTVELFGDTGTEYRCKEQSGLWIFVQYSDAIVVKSEEELVDENASGLECEVSENGRK